MYKRRVSVVPALLLQLLSYIKRIPEALGWRRMLEHEDGDVYEVMFLQSSFRLVAPVHERKRDGNGEK